MSETTTTDAQSGTQPATQAGVEPEAKPTEKTFTAEDRAKLQKALDAEREARRSADKRIKDLEPLEAKAREAEEANKTEQQKAQDRASAAEAKVAEAEQRATEAIAAANRRLVQAEARALAAAARFVDPGDAARFLDLAQVKVDQDGAVDSAAIAQQLEDLAKTKPYLLAETKGAYAPAAAAGIATTGTSTAARTTPGMGTLRAAYSTTSPK